MSFETHPHPETQSPSLWTLRSGTERRASSATTLVSTFLSWNAPGCHPAPRCWTLRNSRRSSCRRRRATPCNDSQPTPRSFPTPLTVRSTTRSRRRSSLATSPQSRARSRPWCSARSPRSPSCSVRTPRSSSAKRPAPRRVTHGMTRASSVGLFRASGPWVAVHRDPTGGRARKSPALLGFRRPFQSRLCSRRTARSRRSSSDMRIVRSSANSPRPSSEHSRTVARWWPRRAPE